MKLSLKQAVDIALTPLGVSLRKVSDEYVVTYGTREFRTRDIQEAFTHGRAMPKEPPQRVSLWGKLFKNKK